MANIGAPIMMKMMKEYELVRAQTLIYWRKMVTMKDDD